MTFDPQLDELDTMIDHVEALDDSLWEDTESANEMLATIGFNGRFIDGLDSGDTLLVDHTQGTFGITATHYDDSVSIVMDSEGARELNEFLGRELDEQTLGEPNGSA